MALVSAHAVGPAFVLVRLAHLLEAGNASAVTVALGSLLGGGARVVGVTEMTIVGTVPLASVPAVTYRRDGGLPPVTLPVVPPSPTAPDYSVTLAPMQFRAFRLQVA